MKFEVAFRWILLIVLFVVMVVTTASWQQAQHNAGIGDGNRELLCDSMYLRLQAEANGDPFLTDAYTRRCNEFPAPPAPQVN